MTFAQAQDESVCHVIDDSTPVTENARVATYSFRHCDINVGNNEAMALKTEDLSGELGPLPPMKIHCAELVEGAMRSALEGKADEAAQESAAEPGAQPAAAGNLIESLNAGDAPSGGLKIVMLDEDEA